MTGSTDPQLQALEDAASVWPLGGYAPGDYFCLCDDCGRQFEGDKRAVQCAPCAARGAVITSRAQEARIAELASRLAEQSAALALAVEGLKKGRYAVPRVMQALLNTKSRDNLLLAAEVHKADDVARETLARLSGEKGE